MPLITRKQKITEEVVDGFKCNRCGAKYTTQDIVEFQEMFHWQTYAGYGSLWGDGNHVEVVLCQKCAYAQLFPYSEIINL